MTEQGVPKEIVDAFNLIDQWVMEGGRCPKWHGRTWWERLRDVDLVAIKNSSPDDPQRLAREELKQRKLAVGRRGWT